MQGHEKCKFAETSLLHKIMFTQFSVFLYSLHQGVQDQTSQLSHIVCETYTFTCYLTITYMYKQISCNFKYTLPGYMHTHL